MVLKEKYICRCGWNGTIEGIHQCSCGKVLCPRCHMPVKKIVYKKQNNYKPINIKFSKPVKTIQKTIKQKTCVYNYPNNIPINYIVSYPKTGVTWLRVILTYYKYIEMEKNVNEILAIDIRKFERIYYKDYNFGLSFTHDDDIINFDNLIKLEKTKEKYFNNKNTVIFLFRNTLDTFTSLYYELMYRSNKIYYITINSIIYRLLPKYVEWHNIWAKEIKKHKDECIIIRYEDMIEDTLFCMKQIFNLWQIKYDISILKKAIDEASFDKLQKKELAGLLTSDKSFSSGKNVKKLKCRKGIVGDYKNVLSETQISRIEKETSKLDKIFN